MVKDRGVPTLPSHVRLAWPTLQVMKRLNRPAKNAEVARLVAKEIRLTPEQISILSGSGSRTLLEYRLCWSRTFLKTMGAIAKIGPAEWAVTKDGCTVTEVDIDAASKQLLHNLKSRG